MKTQLKVAPRKHRKIAIVAASPAALNANTQAVKVKPVEIASNTLPVFSVEAAMLIAEELRVTASSNHQQYVVPGRKAMLEVLSKVYDLYHNAKASSEFEPFMNNVRNKLTLNGFEIRENSQDSSLLVRLIFADASDKKVHVWGRALDVAFGKHNTTPGNFKALVAATPNGLEGLRDQGAKKPTATDGSKLAFAISVIENEPTVDTIAAEDWRTGEKCRIYIAVLNDDGLVDLKDSQLEKKHLDATLLLVKADKDRRENPPVDTKGAVDKAVHKAMLLQNESQLRSEQAKLADLELRLKAAISDDDNALSQALKFSISVSTAQVDSLQFYLKSLRDGVKSEPESILA